MLVDMRWFGRAEPAVLSLNVQAQMLRDERERSQFEVLVRHLLSRFFNNDMISADGETPTRVIQVAYLIALPGLLVALFLFPAYHLFPPYMAKRGFWPQASDHFFYVAYSLVVMGAVTVFQWDLLFPDLLDVFVLSTLSIASRRVFLARVLAIAIFLVLFLVGTNLLGTIFMPMVADLPSLVRHLFAHFAAVSAGGIFSAALFLSVQGVLMSVLGERLFRRVSSWLQGISMMLLMTVLFLFPLLSHFLQALLTSGSPVVRYFPPFWFLGIYERILAGPGVMPVFASLARTGWWATLLVVVLSVATYPVAYRRRTRQLIEGYVSSDTRSWIGGLINRLLNASVLRIPAVRAIYHFTGQTLLRTLRNRVYLAMYGGVGVAIVVAGLVILRFGDGHVRIAVASFGVRSAIPVVAFWAIAGLRAALGSPVDVRGNWVFRLIHGRPKLNHLVAAETWVFLWAMVISLATVVALHAIAPPELRGLRATLCQGVVAILSCLLLTDAFFMQVRSIPFTAVRVPSSRDLPWVVVRYLFIFPFLVMTVVGYEPWMEASLRRLVVVICWGVAAHFVLRMVRLYLLREQARMVDLDVEEGFLQGLRLRD